MAQIAFPFLENAQAISWLLQRISFKKDPRFFQLLVGKKIVRKDIRRKSMEQLNSLFDIALPEMGVYWKHRKRKYSHGFQNQACLMSLRVLGFARSFKNNSIFFWIWNWDLFGASTLEGLHSLPKKEYFPLSGSGFFSSGPFNFSGKLILPTKKNSHPSSQPGGG